MKHYICVGLSLALLLPVICGCDWAREYSQRRMERRDKEWAELEERREAEASQQQQPAQQGQWVQQEQRDEVEVINYIVDWGTSGKKFTNYKWEVTLRNNTNRRKRVEVTLYIRGSGGGSSNPISSMKHSTPGRRAHPGRWDAVSWRRAGR